MEEEMHRDLYIAAMSGNVTSLDEIYKNKKKKIDIVGELTPYGDTALHIAASYAHLDFVKKLIELSKADTEAGTEILKAYNMDGNTALHAVCMGGSYPVLFEEDKQLTCVKVLLQEDEQLACERNLWGETPVFKAAERGHSRIVKTLLPMTPSEGLRRWDGQTPLHLAVRNSKEDVIRLLLKNKADLAKEADMFGRTPLHIASSTDFSIWKRILKLHEDDIREMIILKNRSACYIKDDYGQTPLHIAVKEGNSGMTKKLLKYEPYCIEKVDADGRNALHLAVEHATQIYVRSGRDLRRIMASVTVPTLVNRIDKYGQTLLAIAAEKEIEDPELHKAIRVHLLTKGASREEAGTARDEAKKDEPRAEPITVNISLIATVAFTLPTFRNHFLFYVLVIADALAFCYSLGVALLLIYVHGNPNLRISEYINASISIAGASLATTFGAAIHIAVAPHSSWFPFIVWFMPMTMIYAWVISFYGKLILFEEGCKRLFIIGRLARLFFFIPQELFFFIADHLLALLPQLKKAYFYI